MSMVEFSHRFKTAMRWIIPVAVLVGLVLS